MPALADLDDGGAVTLDDYCDERLKLLAHVPHANPRFSKLAFGRCAWFPLLCKSWDSLSAWTVFFARRLQLAEQPSLRSHQRPQYLLRLGPLKKGAQALRIEPACLRRARQTLPDSSSNAAHLACSLRAILARHPPYGMGPLAAKQSSLR
jgi:hypothetical protein